MTLAFLDGAFMPIEQARISPLDRGFLFGDGAYEVIPHFDGQPVGFRHHIDRLHASLAAIGIEQDWSHDRWRTLCSALVEGHPAPSVSVYLQVTRGADTKRGHAFPAGIPPTVFAFAFAIPAAPGPDKARVPRFRACTQRDLRWRRCNIKATSLLGNVLHFQHGRRLGCDETILFNADRQLTEASTSNVYAVSQGEVVTPPLSDEVLPGITRRILLDILRTDGSIPVVERPVRLDELFSADEVWLTSSSKEIVPVVEVDGRRIADGGPGDTWLRAQALYSTHKYHY